MNCGNDELRLPDHKKGTTWDGISLAFSNKEEGNVKTPMDVSAIEVVGKLIKGRLGSTALEMSTDNGAIVMGDTENPIATNIISFLPRIINLPAYDYTFEIKIYYPDGTNYPFPKIFLNITD
jgi:hypothetical protein